MVSLASPRPQGSGINLENHDDDNFEHAYGNDFETNRRYLSLSWWLLHRGCLDLIKKVTTAVEDVFGSLNPRDEITLERLSELTLEVRKRVEGVTEEDRRSVYITSSLPVYTLLKNFQDPEMASIPPPYSRPRGIRTPTIRHDQHRLPLLLSPTPYRRNLGSH